MDPISGGIQSVVPVFHVLLAVDVASAVVSTGFDVGYTVTTPDDEPGITDGMSPAWFHTKSPRNSKGETIASFGAFLFALVSVLVAPNPNFFQR